MSLDLGVIFADALSSFAVALMLIILKKFSEYDRRIQRIESDLYVGEGNPTSMPLTTQVHGLQQDVAVIKDKCQDLHATMETINNTFTDFLKRYTVQNTKKVKRKVKL
jgi:hypothetical protein